MSRLTWQALDNRPLVAIDQILAAVSGGHISPGNATDYLTHCLLLALDREELWLEQREQALFDDSLTKSDRELVAMTMLRLLSAEPNLFEGGTRFAVGAVRLFDSELDDVYRRANIHVGDQGHLKRAALRDVVHEAEHRLDVTLASLTSMSSLARFSTALLREVNGRPRNVILRFLPPDLIATERITATLDAVQQFTAAGPGSVIGRLEEIRQLLQDFRVRAESFGTDYAIRFSGGLADRLLAIVDSEFENSPYSKPATLMVSAVEKKYPLQTEGAVVNLAFALVNEGPGYAMDVVAEAVVLGELECIDGGERFLGRLGIESLVFEVPCVVTASEDRDLVEVAVRWINHDGSQGAITKEIEIAGQPQQVDWATLQYEDPYSAEPVTDRDGLVGRDTVLDGLIRRASFRSVGSSYVTGQKRVGKTSVVRTLQSQLDLLERGVPTVFLETGEFIQQTAAGTISELGRRICTAVRDLSEQYNAVPIPDFEGALSPLATYLADVRRVDPDFRCLIILDEVDELPVDVYRKGPLGNAAFATIRSISGRPGLGFILVGGENLTFVHNEQGELLNKFTQVLVTYLSRDQWSDFENLIRMPTKDWLEISDEAVALLWDRTAGNPFFAKLLCRELFAMMLERRDSHVTEAEVRESSTRAIRNAGAPAFQHFWEDGLSPFEESSDQVLLRKRIFLAMGPLVRDRESVPREDLVDSVVGLYAEIDRRRVEMSLDDLMRREVLRSVENNIACNVPLFGDWLAAHGAREILQTLPELQAAEVARLEEERADVEPEEIVDLIQPWGTYKGQTLTEDRVRSWLRQFGSKVDQRLAFKLLQAVRFYSTGLIREKLKEAHGIVLRGMRSQVSLRRVRRDILVSYLGGTGKSSAQYARLYADENQIAKDNVVAPEQVAAALEKRGHQSLVFIDDFIGTGGSASRSISHIAASGGDAILASGVNVHIIAITGFDAGVRVVEAALTGVAETWQLNVCDPLGESNKAFGSDSIVFTDTSERERGQRLFEERGRRALPGNPLGFGECAALVVFDSNCPNNSLPVLWASDREDWVPLFRRS